MSFDFSSAVAEAKKDIESDALFLLLLGQPGGGKSYAQGTFGVKTLYLYTGAECHGPKSATKSALRKGQTDVIVPVRIDADNSTPDQAYKRLLTILTDIEGIKKLGIKAITLDGATEIEAIIRGTTDYKNIVQNQYKGVESYAGPAVLALFRPILTALRNLRVQLGIHVCMTCILDVTEYAIDGAIASAKPTLAGYNVAMGLIQWFDDRIVVGKMKRGDGSVGYPFQLGSEITRSTQDFKTKEIRKIHHVNIQLSGCDMTSFPEAIPSDLSLLIKYKEAGKFVE